MTARRARTVAAVAWVAGFVGAIVTAVLVVVRRDPVVPNTFGMGHLAMLAFLGFGVAWTTVGALLVANRPANLVGRIALLIGVAYIWSVLSTAIVFALVEDGSQTAMTAAGWLGWTTGLAVMLGGLAFILATYFPTGRGHTPAWHAVGRALVLLTAVIAVLLLSQPGSLHLFPTIDNPLGVGPDLRPVLGGPMFATVSLAATAAVPIIAIGFVARYRAAGATERLQLRWYAAATMAWVAGLILVTTAGALFPGRLGELPLTVFAVTGVLIPLAIGVAIMRYRLYDIDHLISRTLSWAIVTGGIVAVFGVLVVGLQAALSGITQGETLAVALSTLVAAALFQPVRRQVQRIVDRRFDRATYDATQTILDLVEHLRDEVDLGHLAGDVLGAVDATLHPASRSLWIRTTTVIESSGADSPVTISGHSLPKVTPT